MKTKFYLLTLLLIFLALQLQCHRQEISRKTAAEQSEPGWSAGDIDWSKIDPIGFIAILKEHKDGWITVGQAPIGWIKKHHVEQLMTLIDSKDPAVPVVSIISSYLPFKERSTVGNEAMFLIEGFRKGRYPPGLCSVYGFKGDPEEYKRWYENQKR